MIVFNFGAVVILAIAVAIGLGLDGLFPMLFTGPYSGFASSLIAVIVGGAGEIVGIRGRLFFIPIWMIGLGMMMYSGHALWGIWGIVGPLVLLVLGLWWLVKAASQMEASRWSKAGTALSELRSCPLEGEPKQFWRLVSESLFLPVLGDFSGAMLVHDLEVARIVQARESKQMPPDEFAAWAGLTAFLERSKQQDQRPPLDLALRKQIQRFILLRVEK
jgi:hypothetical protein